MRDARLKASPRHGRAGRGFKDFVSDPPLGVPSGAAAFIANRDERHQSIIISEYSFFSAKTPHPVGGHFF